jgi:hypothetical protein
MGKKEVPKNTRGLKIQEKWIRKIFSGEKTMEVRSMRYRVLGQRIALGNSGTGLVEGYGTVQEIVDIPYSKISKYASQHRATEWLRKQYKGRNILYGFVLREVKRKKEPFPYPKSPGIWFNI